MEANAAPPALRAAEARLKVGHTFHQWRHRVALPARLTIGSAQPPSVMQHTNPVLFLAHVRNGLAAGAGTDLSV